MYENLERVTQLPRQVHRIDNTWIPMPDGARLAARIWLPEGAEHEPVPAILEYIPYRKRDFTAVRDSITHPYLAGHGYACVRVDLRGSGDSDGVLEDEYLESELADGVEVIRWIASQQWCNGNVGMIGISWGGFNGLQIAALQPPELKAVISLCSTDDRYTDDVHYMGGCLLGDNLSWATAMFAYNSLPPDPETVGERWRDMWLERLAGSGLWLEKWLAHQRRDGYWRHASVCEDYSRIQCPVLAASGWADGYSNAVFRLMVNLRVPRKGLIGPWAHMYPHLGLPGPDIGFLQESLRWWDKWLKGIETGIMEEPMLRVWMQDSVPPTTSYKTKPGRWVAEPAWPSPNVRPRRYALEPARLVPEGEAVDDTAPLAIRSPLSVGLFAGKWCSYAAAPDLPHDQREEDGGALVFDTAPLEETVEILGAPYVELEVASSRPVAMIAARLSDVNEEDKATRVTYGLLNLTHRDSHESPRPLALGRRYRVRVDLNDIAQSFPPGHRLRLSLSTSYWPLAWPPPEPVRLTIYPGHSSLVLPVRAPRAGDEALAPFEPAEGAPPLQKTILEPGHRNWRVVRDLAEDVSTLEVVNDSGRYRLEDIDLEIRSDTREWYRYRGDDFSSAEGETQTIRALRRGDWQVRTRTRTILTSTPTHFAIRAELDAHEGASRVYCRSWDTEIPRDLV